MAKTTEVATVPDTDDALPPVLRALRDEGDDIREMLAENLAGTRLGKFDLPRLKVPSGGGVAFNRTTSKGADAAKTVRGVIIHQGPGRQMWRQRMEESSGNTPPDCVSVDGLTGIGDPGGDCASCSLNQFGSADSINGKESRGKKCKEGIQVFMLLDDAYALPTMLQLPPTSIKAFRGWINSISQENKRYWRVYVEIGLQGVKNANGPDYSVATFTLLDYVTDPAIVSVIRDYREQIQAELANAAPVVTEDSGIDASDLGGDDGGIGGVA
jgi:hypothetical protein